MIKLLPLTVLLLAGLVEPGFAQGQPTQDQPAQEERPDRFDIGASYLGAFPSASTGDGVHQGATASGGVLATFRWLLNAHNGVEFDGGYTRDTEQFLTYSASGAAYEHAVHTDMEEGTASYVFRAGISPHAGVFLSAGGGALVFDPLRSGTIAPVSPNTQARATFVYAAGMEFAIGQHFMLRPEYRAFVLKAPNFGTGLGADAGMYIPEMVAAFAWKL